MNHLLWAFHISSLSLITSIRVSFWGLCDPFPLLSLLMPLLLTGLFPVTFLFCFVTTELNQSCLSGNEFGSLYRSLVASLMNMGIKTITALPPESSSNQQSSREGPSTMTVTRHRSGERIAVSMRSWSWGLSGCDVVGKEHSWFFFLPLSPILFPTSVCNASWALLKVV